MFKVSRVLFIYCVSPVHLGAGTAVGLIDNPIQRERHTDYPMFAGSGLKGAIRHHYWASYEGEKPDRRLLNRLFGPDTNNAAEHAGALSFGDAQLVAFPVRSARRGFVYVTSPLCLGRLVRMLQVAGVDMELPELPDLQGQALVCDEALLEDRCIALETFEFAARVDKHLQAIAVKLAENALPDDPAYQYFQAKVSTDLVCLPEAEFAHFVKHATVVEPHVRIDDVSGTAAEGGLFYTENLPPESLMVSLIMASRERVKEKKPRSEAATSAEGSTDTQSSPEQPLTAETVMDTLLGGKTEEDGTLPPLNGLLLQVGGDATTGRGQVMLRTLGNERQEAVE